MEVKNGSLLYVNLFTVNDVYTLCRVLYHTAVEVIVYWLRFFFVLDNTVNCCRQVVDKEKLFPLLRLLISCFTLAWHIQGTVPFVYIVKCLSTANRRNSCICVYLSDIITVTEGLFTNALHTPSKCKIVKTTATAEGFFSGKEYKPYFDWKITKVNNITKDDAQKLLNKVREDSEPYKASRYVL